jgi:hypothetical protein
MKKLLNIIGASVILSSSAVVASCSLDPSAPIEINDAIDLQNFFNKLQTNRPELSEDFNVGFEGQNDTYIKALEKIFDQEQVVHTAFINKLLSTDFYANKDNVIGYDIQKTGKTLGKTSLVRNADHKVNANVADKNLSDYFYEKVAKPDEKPVDNRVDLASVITTTDLGNLVDNNSATILDAVKKANSGLNTNEVEIKNITETSAVVAAKSGSTVYTGDSVTVTFKVVAPVEKTDLSTIATKELGDIPNADAATIVEAMNTANDGLNLTEADVDVTPNDDKTGATVKAKDGSENFTGSVEVTFKVVAPVEKTDLSQIATKELGDIPNTDAVTIVEAMNAANDGLNLTEDDVDITPNDDKTGATVKAKDGSENFTGSVEVTFKVVAPIEKTDLSTIATKELGDIPNTDAATIVEAMNTANDGLGLTETDVDVTPNDDKTGATVKAKDESENFTGSVEVTFKVVAPVEKTDLSTIATKELGPIADTNAATIVEAMNTANDGLNLTEADVDITPNGDNTGATVKAKDESENFTGSVDVTFTIKKDLSTIATKELGPIADTNAATIVEAMNTANDGLNLTEADIDITPNGDNTGATVKAKDESEKFTGSVDVTFTIKKDLSTIATKDLGTIDNTDAATIVEAMNTANDGLNLTEADVDITPNGDNTGATVKAKDESENFTGSVDVTFTLPSDESVDINTIITADNSDLGEIVTPDESGIKAGLTAKIPKLNQDQVTITPVDDTSATIAPIEGSTVYTGSPVTVTFTLPAKTNYYSILNSHRLLTDGPQYSYNDYTMTIMIGSEDLFNLDHAGFVYIPFTILPK